MSSALPDTLQQKMTEMIKYYLKIQLIVFLCICPVFVSGQGDKNSFFSGEDIANIRYSSRTDQGKLIIESLKGTVRERRLHDLRVPLLESGHLHHYFCPVHNIMFSFDWNSPHAHYCKVCDKKWENNNFFDWAWINTLHAENLKYLTACMYLYMATEDKVYAEYIRDMLLDYAHKYPTYFEHNPNRKATSLNSGKMFGQSLDEAVWASDAARAFCVAKPIMSQQEITKIEKGYLQPCADMLLNRKGGWNWQVWHNSGLIALGVALENDSILDVALNDPKCGYYFLMDAHVYSDGWWSEGSPIYHYYPLHAMILSALALRSKGIDLFDNKLYNMFASPALGVYSDLSFPAHNDGWYGESLPAQVSLYEMAYSHYKDDLLRNVIAECYRKVSRNTPEALLNKIGTDNRIKYPNRESMYFRNVGVAILRSQNKTVVLKYGPHGGGHGHPDKLSVSIHNGEKELVSDLGTSAYGVPDYIRWYRKTLSHNTVIVDYNDQKPATGDLVSFKKMKDGGEVGAKVSEAYPGIVMNRKLSLDKNKITDMFSCASSEDHVYDYVLVLNEKPEIPGQSEPVLLNESEAYKRISAAKKRRAKNMVSIQTKSTGLKIESLTGENFEIINGEAPGIPPRNPALKENEGLKPCYPLIIRIKGKNMKIRTTWNLK